MKIQKIKTRKSLKFVYIILAAIVVVVVAFFVFQHYIMKTSAADKVYYPSKTKTLTDESVERHEREKSVKSSDDSTSSTVASKYIPTINSAMFNAKENGGDGSIDVRVMMTQATSGSCALKATSPSTKTVEQKVSLISGGNYYVCSGFTIPAEQINEKGEWTITVTYIQTDGVISAPVSRKVVVY